MKTIKARLDALEAITPAEPLKIQIIWLDKALDGTITKRPGPVYIYNQPGQPPDKIDPQKEEGKSER